MRLAVSCTASAPGSPPWRDLGMLQRRRIEAVKHLRILLHAQGGGGLLAERSVARVSRKAEDGHVARLHVDARHVHGVGPRAGASVAGVCAYQQYRHPAVAAPVKRKGGGRALAGLRGLGAWGAPGGVGLTMGGRGRRLRAIAVVEDRGEEIAGNDGVVAGDGVRSDGEHEDHDQPKPGHQHARARRTDGLQGTHLRRQPGVDDREHPHEHDDDIDEEKGQEHLGLDCPADDGVDAPREDDDTHEGHGKEYGEQHEPTTPDAGHELANARDYGRIQRPQ